MSGWARRMTLCAGVFSLLWGGGVGRTVAAPLPDRAEAARRHPKLFSFAHAAMGTEFTLYLYSDRAEEAETISEEVFDEVDRVEQLLSNYRETSELSRINREAGTGAVRTDAEMLRFLEEAQYWSQVSDGAFDITVGRLMKAWGFYGHGGRVPTDEELAQLRRVTGWEKVELDRTAMTVHFTADRVELDPGGIGKGFAVDAAVAVLRADHVKAAMLSAGGSTLYGLGAPPHRRGWKIVVPGPLPRRGPLSMVLLRDTSLSSADCSRKNFTADGHLYCHIMDPHTMRPVEGRLQLSVIDPSATASDALSNVLFVDRPEESVRVLRQYAPEARALILSRTNGVVGCTLFRWQGQVELPHCRGK